MLTTPMDVLTAFPVRKSKQQKQAFRDEVQSYVTSLVYESTVEQGSFGCRNLIIGNPAKAKYLVTAHYDTGIWSPIPDIALPCNPFLTVGYQIAAAIGFLLLLGLAMCLPVSLVCTLGGDPFWEAFMFSFIFSPVLGLAAFLGVSLLLILFSTNKNNANYNTSGVITLLEIARTLPQNQRHKVCFVLFDLQEFCCIGSASYRKTHKQETDSQLVLNLDCVGHGDNLRIFPTDKLKKDCNKLKSAYKLCGYFGRKNLLVFEGKHSAFYSDHKIFPYAVSICALRKGKAGLYFRNHTAKDTILEETNINILRAAISSLICCGAVQ